MYCSTCGAFIPAGRAACDTCGARVAGAAPAARVRIPAPQAEGAYPRAIGVCPRCAYRGDGVGYFTRGRHLAGLIVAAMVTSWGMGVGALVYYLMRRDHRICPRCGEGWGQRGEYALTTGTAPPASPATVTATPVTAAIPRESARRAWSVLFFILAAFLAVVAITQGEPGPLVIAGIAAGGGVLLHRAAENERDARRAALISSLQLPVLKLAAERNGRLTVTQVATQLGWTLPRAEKVLESLEDGYRVSSEVTDEGLIVYEFRELLDDVRSPRSLEGEA